VLYDDDYKRVNCPFFVRGTKSRSIVCESAIEGANVQLNFLKAGGKEEYMTSFCCSDGCWRGCVLYQNAMEKYE